MLNLILEVARYLFVWTPLVLSFCRHRAMSSTSLPGTFSVTFVTVPDRDVANNISRGLVENKLAACVNIIPGVTSVYMWKNEINEDNELILKIKTRTSIIDRVIDFVKKNHPYEVCEVISTPITNGNPAYLSWLDEVVPDVAAVSGNKTDP